MGTEDGSLVRRRQARCGRAMRGSQEATIVKRVRTLDGLGTDPLHGLVAPDPRYDVTWPYGVDRAVGGLHDAPNPGELLRVALAACHDASMRMVADLLGIHDPDPPRRRRMTRTRSEREEADVRPPT
jgi:hypothetical protein